MKKNDAEDELRPEYDIKSLLKNSVRGKYAQRYKEGTNLVLLEPDVFQFFPNEKAVNDALRQLIEIKKMKQSA